MPNARSPPYGTLRRAVHGTGITSETWTAVQQARVTMEVLTG